MLLQNLYNKNFLVEISFSRSSKIIDELKDRNAIKLADKYYEILNADVVKSFLINAFIDKNENILKKETKKLLNGNELSNLLKNKTIVVLDTEVTGLDCENSDIVEIAGIKLVKGKIVNEFYSLCKPSKKIAKNVESLIGITNKMLKNSPRTTEVMKKFLNFIEGAVLVGYNVSFDYKFIKHYAQKENIEVKNDLIDCYEYVKSIFPNQPNYKFKTVMKLLEIEDMQDISVSSSARATLEMFLKMIDLLK